jgi:ribokinase
MRDKIVVVGSLNYDMILKLPRFPEVGETLSADDAVCSAGGKGANQAVQAAKLGVPTYMVGCVGQDSYGDYLIESAVGYGVNTGFIRRSVSPTGMGIVSALPDGDVKAVIVKGANYAITRADIDALEGILDTTALVILQMEIPLEINEYVTEKAKAHGCQVLLNAAPAQPCSEEFLKKLDILVANEVEAAFYLGHPLDTKEEALAGVKSMSRSLGIRCIFTLGKLGSVVSDGDEAAFVPSLKVNAVESTGAGDSFIGGLGYALLHEMELVEACRFATKCSAVTVCRYGAQPSMPTIDEIE